MKCPLCKLDMIIKKSRNIVEIIDGEPHLYIDMDMSCRNRECKNFEKVVETVRNEQPIG